MLFVDSEFHIILISYQFNQNILLLIFPQLLKNAKTVLSWWRDSVGLTPDQQDLLDRYYWLPLSK